MGAYYCSLSAGLLFSLVIVFVDLHYVFLIVVTGSDDWVLCASKVMCKCSYIPNSLLGLSDTQR